MNTELIASIVDGLSHVPGLTVKYRRPVRNEDNDGTLGLRYHGVDACFRIETRKQITTTVVNMMLAASPPDQFKNLLLIAPSVTPGCAALMKSRDICYADAAGNLFLHSGPLYLHVSGKKSSKPDRRNDLMPKRQSFPANTLKLVFALLTDPDLNREPAKALLSQNYRTMGKITGLPLGSIAGAMSALQSGGYLVIAGKGERLLLERRKLLNQWIDDYSARLRPNLVSAHFRVPSSKWWVNADIHAANGVWGGEVAGAKMTAYLSPEIATIYSDDFPGEFVLTYALYKDPAGKVEILKPFWGPLPWATHEDCVHPLLVYADLMASEIDRNVETAQRVYDQYLRQLIEPD